MKTVEFLLDLPPEASSFARGIDALHAFVFGTAVVGSFAVMALAIFFIARYDESRAVKRRRHTGHSSTAWELFVVGGITSLFVLWWAIGFHQFDHMVNPPKNAMIVYVTAKQWMWKFEHESGEIELGSLTVPEGVPVELVMTSRDVIHSFYVPAFRVKEDVIPGRYTTMWFEATATGDFPLRCAELCGAGHSKMLATVHVVARAQFADALRALGPQDARVRRGLDAAAQHGCLACHSLDDSPRIGPSWFNIYGTVETMRSGEQVLVDDAYLTQSMMDPGARVVQGFDDVMPSFAGALAPEDAGAIVQLIRSLHPVGVAAAATNAAGAATSTKSAPKNETTPEASGGGR